MNKLTDIEIEKVDYVSEALPTPALVPSEDLPDPGRNPLCVNSPYHSLHNGQPCPVTIT